ncbi:MAG: S-layer homology domain-containing protein [Oscillospiraceae bacterium]|nr:S-layer homology domain-containing protein [Oscillospiraceae bacterium]
MLKKTISFILTIVLVCGAVLTTVGAASFPDLDGHWSRADMEECAERGLFEGYPDGSIKPNASVSVAETIAIISRLYDITDLEKEFILNQYGQASKEIIVAEGPTWARDALAICLASGAVLDTELRGAAPEKFNAPIKKEVLAMWLVRGVLAEEELDSPSPDFTDVDKIPSRYLSYVALLYNIGVLQGDENRNFNPGSDVSRAVAATMFNKALKYRERNYDTAPQIQGIDNESKAEGVIISHSGSEMVIADAAGLYRQLKVGLDITPTYKDPGIKVTSDTDYFVTLYFNTNGKVVNYYIDNTAAYAVGMLSDVLGSSNAPRIELENYHTGKTALYNVAADCKSADSGDRETYNTLKAYPTGFALARLNSKAEVQEIKITRANYKLSGVLTKIVFESPGSVTLTSGGGDIYILPFDVSDLPEMERNGKVITITDIRESDHADITVESGKIKIMNLETYDSGIHGYVTAITKTADGWTIAIKQDAKDADTTAVTYKTDKNVIVTFDENKNDGSTMLDVNVGDYVVFSILNGVVMEIYAEAGDVTLSGEYNGTLVSFSRSEEELVLLVNGTPRKVTVDDDTSILDNKNNEYYDAKEFERNFTSKSSVKNIVLTVYGSYEGGEFVATLVVITSYTTT